MKKKPNKKEQMLEELYKQERALFNEIVKGTAYRHFILVQDKIYEQNEIPKKTINTKPERFIENF